MSRNNKVNCCKLLAKFLIYTEALDFEIGKFE